MDDEIIRLQVPRWVHLLLVISALITLGAAGYIYTGPVVTAIVMLAGWLA